jgi:hypothetical protein
MADVDAQFEQFAVNACAPHSGFSRLVVRMSSRTAPGTDGRPALPRRIFQYQNKRKAWRCQPTTVAAFTMDNPASQPLQTEHSQDQRSLSATVSLGGLPERCRTRVENPPTLQHCLQSRRSEPHLF